MELQIARERAIKFLRTGKVLDVVQNEMGFSLNSIGLSRELITDFLVAAFLEGPTVGELLEFGDFQKKHGEELKYTYEQIFFEQTTMDFFCRWLVPYVPESSKLLDFGCGAGNFSRLLGNIDFIDHVQGIDVWRSSHWEKEKPDNVNFDVVPGNEVRSFLINYKPDTVILTWVLHHIPRADRS